MNCSNCGSAINPGDSFCQNCGTPVPVAASTPEAAPTPVVPVSPEIPAAPEVAPTPVAPVAPEIPATPEVAPTPEPIPAAPEVAPTPVAPVAPEVPATPEVAPTPEPIPATPEMAPVAPTPMPSAVAPTPAQPLEQPVAVPTTEAPSAPAAPKKGNAGLVIAIVAIVVGLIIAIIMVIPKLTNNNNNGGNTPVDNGGESGTNEPTTTGSEVTYRGYTFNIPDEYDYQFDDNNNVLLVGTVDRIAQIGVVDIPYSNLTVNTDYYTSKGATVMNFKIGNYGSIEFKTAEISLNTGVKFLIGYTKASASQAFAIDFLNQDNTYDYDLITNLSPVFASAKYTGAENSFSKPSDNIYKSTSSFDVTSVDGAKSN